MLLSFIERLLILSVKQINSASHAYSGIAVKMINNSLDHDYLKRYTPELLYLFNSLSCLSSVYENSNGFQNEPNKVNRHFMMHGMSNRKITYYDCAKLFLLVYNLVFLFDYLVSTKKEV